MAYLRWRRILLCCLFLIAIRLPGQAQEHRAASEDQLTTLHVYLDLIQVPVLVLDSSLHRMKPVDPAKFRVSLDSGPEFRPTHVRQQGEDPIGLGILLDTSEGDAKGMLKNIDFAVASLAPESLEVRDHVSVYGFDCHLTRSLNGISANPAQLKVGVDVALRLWKTRLTEHRRCEDRVGLWDAMRFAVKDMAQLPGRRALLLVSSSVSGSGGSGWNELRRQAQVEGVAVFGLVPSSLLGWGRENALSETCELSGGILSGVPAAVEKQQLARFVAMLRERYIIEFGRARNEEPGAHSLTVTLEDRRAVLRPAGVSVSLSDPGTKADPTTLRNNEANAPEYGTRRVLTPK